MKIYAFVIFSSVLLISLFVSDKGQTLESNDMLLANIEALADDENPDEISCWGVGDVVCPITGQYVKKVIISYALE